MTHNRFKVSNQFFLYFFSDHFAAFSHLKKTEKQSSLNLMRRNISVKHFLNIGLGSIKKIVKVKKVAKNC